MKKHQHSRLVLPGLALLFAPAMAAAQVGGPFDVSWHSVDGGGGTSSGGTISITGTVGQPDASIFNHSGGVFCVTGGFWAVLGGAGISITGANPPIAAANPFQLGQPYTDVLDTGSGLTVTAGIGAPGTLPQGAVIYSPIHVTFSCPPIPAPAPGNVTVSCVGGSLPCPTVTGVAAGPGVNEFLITLSGGIPPLSCTSITFSGGAGLRLQYRSNPGNVNLDTFGTTTQDVLFLVQRINDGSANLPENQARYNVNRSALAPPHVNTQDLLRLVQLLNGVNTTQVFNGTVAAACPP